MICRQLALAVQIWAVCLVEGNVDILQVPDPLVMDQGLQVICVALRHWMDAQQTGDLLGGCIPCACWLLTRVVGLITWTMTRVRGTRPAQLYCACTVLSFSQVSQVTKQQYKEMIERCWPSCLLA